MMVACHSKRFIGESPWMFRRGRAKAKASVDDGGSIGGVPSAVDEVTVEVFGFEGLRLVGFVC